MEISEILINGNGFGPNITLYRKQLKHVKTFKNISVMFIENGTSKKDILSRLATSTAAMVRLEKIWKFRDFNSISSTSSNLHYLVRYSLVYMAVNMYLVGRV